VSHGRRVQTLISACRPTILKALACLRPSVTQEAGMATKKTGNEHKGEGEGKERGGGKSGSQSGSQAGGSKGSGSKGAGSGSTSKKTSRSR
jgi:hypothetical protein